MPNAKDFKPIAVPFDRGCEMGGHGRDKGYVLCKSGEYETYMDGGRRMITVRSIEARINRLLKQHGGAFNPAPMRGARATKRSRSEPPAM